MNILLQALEKSPEYQQLLDAISRGSVAAVSGLSQITRSHFLAALHAKSSRPSVFLVQDELAASRLQEELESFLGVQIPILPERELTFVEASGVSRQWEQKRLRLLYGAQCSMELESEPNTGTAVTLRFPIRKEAEA